MRVNAACWHEQLCEQHHNRLCRGVISFEGRQNQEECDEMVGATVGATVVWERIVQ